VPANADSVRDEQGHNCLYLRPSACIVPFDFDSTRITPKGRAVIDLVLDFGKQYGFCSPLAVIGQADRAGPNQYNMALSLRRAEAVRDALAAGGYVKDGIVVGRMGETQLQVETPDGVPNADNRVAVVYVEYGGCGPFNGKDTP
jgi:OOP family OmpA-OmpF porin